MAETQEPDTYLTPRQAVAHLGGAVGPRYLARLADRGELRARRLEGGHRRYSRRGLDELQERMTISEKAS